jgi:hypothetical protein
MMRLTLLLSLVACLGPLSLDAQAICGQPSAFCKLQTADGRQLTALQENQRSSILGTVVHTGKWLTAAAAIGFTVMASNQHGSSRREWDALMEICRSASDACLVGPDGRYLRADAEALYQSSRHYDLLANRWLVGAQLSLVTTTALFIIDLNAGNGPQNIPYPSQIRVGSVGGGAGLEMRLAF